jgi:drug/metabolite transporter (DMT)-like permease
MTEQKSIPPRAWAGLILMALIWGGSFLCVAVALRDIGPLQLVAIRVGLAAALLWPVVLWRGAALPRSGRAWAVLAVMGLLNTALPFTLIAWGQQSIESGLAAILNASTALLGVLVAALFLRDERLTAPRLAGVVIGLAGVVVVVGPGALVNLDPRNLGQMSILGASLCYALAGTWGRRMMPGLAPDIATAGMLTCSAVVMIPVAVLAEGWPGSVSGAGWAAILYITAVGTSAAYMLYYRVLALAGSGNLLLVTLMVAPVAVLLGALVLGEVLHPADFAGFALIALGLVVLDGRMLRAVRARISV